MEVISHQKERIRNMAIYFVENTKSVSMTKLMKLFYFCDRESYVHTGFTISGKEYIAKERGPIIKELYLELNKHGVQNPISINTVIVREHHSSPKVMRDERFFIVKHGKKFQPEYFSKYELRVLETICHDFKDKTGAQMSMESHKQGLPWKETWKDGKGEGDVIDFDLDIKKYTDTERFESIRAAQEAAKNFERQLALL